MKQIQWASSSLAPGVTLLRGSFSNSTSHPDWTVTIQAPTTSPFDSSAELAEAGSASWAAQTEAALRADGFAPTETVLPWPKYADDPRGVMGVRVRVGDFSTRADATALAATLTTDGFKPLVEWTGFDPTPAPDAEHLIVAVVDPARFDGQVMADHGSAVASKQTVPAASAALGSIAATNGGFFTILGGPLTAVNGVNTGISAYHGQIQSLANGDRAAVVFDGRRPARIENLTTSARLHAGGDSIQILGINRLPGSAEDCGVQGFAPTAMPRQNTLCTGANDLVLFTPMFGAPLPPASVPAVQAILDANGRVVSVGAPGGTLPAGDSAVQAIGSDAAWLTAHAQVGQTLTVSEQVRDHGRPVHLDAQTSISSAGPMLLRDGRSAIDAVDEGVLDPRDLNDYTFSAYRHARTFVGVDGHGRLLLATADGVSGVSEGLTLSEEAAVMRSLGAVDAMNLDGGGSTEFASNGQLLNDASSVPLRPDGDTIEVVPHS
ncbi:MAG: phosphodiester glycosidase family protein [Nocardioides sp.]|nr:phosphodiester glycosidase family protein [Nocardioides sp.]